MDPSASGSSAVEPIPPAEIRDQLDRILASRGFRKSIRLQRFLRLAVERTLAGETDQLKEYSVGRDAFDRDADYDPRTDSIVRVEARRLRRKLREYYRAAEGADPIVIRFPRGSYAAEFHRASEIAAGAPAETEVAGPPPDPRTVAVLPFSNLSTEPEQQYFCDGITEDIINALTPIAQLQVIGQTSMFALAGVLQDPREIGARLGAGTIIEGSVRKSGELLRVSAKIIDAETRQARWSQVFDRHTQDVFAIEDEIAHSIAGVLRITLEANQQSMRGAPSTEAHSLYLKGRQAWNRMNRAGFLTAIELFSRANSLYPDYAPPYAGLAYAYMWLSMWAMLDPAQAFPKCRDAARTALRLDPAMASAYASLGACVFFFENDLHGGVALLKKALEIQPSYAFAYQIYGFFLLIMERFEEAIGPIEQAVHLDPLSLGTNRALGIAYYLLSRWEDAEHWIKAAIALAPDSAESHYLLARVYLRQGRLDDALKEALKCDREETGGITLSILGVVLARRGDRAGAEQILKRIGQMSLAGWVDPIAIAGIETALGNFDAALEQVRASREFRSPFAAFAKVDPLFEELRSDPRF